MIVNKGPTTFTNFSKDFEHLHFDFLSFIFIVNFVDNRKGYNKQTEQFLNTKEGVFGRMRVFDIGGQEFEQLHFVFMRENLWDKGISNKL